MSFENFVRMLARLDHFTYRQAFKVWSKDPSGFNIICGWQRLFRTHRLECVKRSARRSDGYVWRIGKTH